MLVLTSPSPTVEPQEWSPLFIWEHPTVQAIQRQLEEVAEKQRDLEERGVAVEKSIRRETGAGKLYSQSILLLQEVQLPTNACDFVLECSFSFFLSLAVFPPRSIS